MKNVKQASRELYKCIQKLVISRFHCYNWINKNALTASLSLTSLEIRSRNEEAIHYTKQDLLAKGFFTSYFMDVDIFDLFLNWFSTRVSDYCGRRL